MLFQEFAGNFSDQVSAWQTSLAILPCSSQKVAYLYTLVEFFVFCVIAPPELHSSGGQLPANETGRPVGNTGVLR